MDWGMGRWEIEDGICDIYYVKVDDLSEKWRLLMTAGMTRIGFRRQP